MSVTKWENRLPLEGMMFKGGNEVSFINNNGCTLSYSPIANLYLSQQPNSNASQHFYGINPQRAGQTPMVCHAHQHADLS